MHADESPSLRLRLALLGLVLIVPLLAFSVITLEGPRFRAKTQADLAAIAQLKSTQIQAWLEDRRNYAQSMMASDGFVAEVAGHLRHPTAASRFHIDSRLAAIRRAYGYEVALIDLQAENAQAVVHWDTQDGLSADQRRALLSQALASKQPQLSDLYRDEQGQVWLDQLIPLVPTQAPESRQVGALALRIPAGAFLFPLLQTWPTPSPSGETLLFRRDGDSVLFLNDLRHRQDTALRLRLPLDSPELPAAMALRLGWGAHFIEGRDYRGTPVLAAAQPVPGTPWTILAKVDRAEVQRPLITLVGWVSLVALLAIAALAWALLRLWRQQQHAHRLELSASHGERDRLLSLFYELPFMGMAIVDSVDCHFLQVNDRLCEILGYRREELLGLAWEQVMPINDGADCEREHQRLLRGEIDAYQLEQRFRRKDGSLIDAALSARCVRDQQGRIEHLVKTFRDISERKQAEEELHQLNRTLQALSASSWALVHAGDEHSYLRYFCQVLIEDCGHALVWIGQALDDPAQSIQLLAQAGFEDGYLDTLPLTWADSEHGQSPCGRAIRDRRPVICQHIDSDPDFQPWREQALRCGYASSIALPVGLDGENILLLNLYSRQPEAFGDAEVQLLLKLADELAYGLGVLRLRSERNQQAEALRASEQRFRLLADATQEAILVSEQGRLVDHNQRLLDMFGYSREEILGQPMTELLNRVAADLLSEDQLANILDKFRSHTTSHFECPLQRKDGRNITVEVHGQTHIGENRTFRITTLRDITERRWAEDVLRRSQTQLYSFIEQAPLSIAMFNRKMNYLAYSRRWLEEYGGGYDDLIGRNHYKVHPTIGEAWREVHRRCLAGETLSSDEDHWIDSQGTEHWLRWSVVPWRDENNEIGGIIMSGEDITDRKRSEDALQEREADLNRAQAVGHIGSWRLDVRRNELTWSEENHRIFEVPPGTAMTYESFLARVHPDDRANVDREWQAAMRGSPYDLEHRLLVNGRVKWVREKATLEFAEDGELLGGFGITQDISDIKQAEQALRESEERFQLAAEIGRSGAWDWDLTRDEMIWSRGHFEILGYALDEVTPGYQAWAERMHPDDRVRVETELQHCMQQHRDFGAEFRVVWADGSVHWMSAHGRFEYGNSGGSDAGHGACTRLVGVMADVTSLKQAELALRATDQRKDEFLAMLAHELRNPLAPIRNAAHVLGRLDIDEPQVRWAQDIIERQVRHLTHLVDDLLDVSRIALGKVTLKKTRVELADLVRQACEAVQPLMNAKQHDFVVQMPEATLALEGDPVRLQQILQNLLHNAAKYTPERGHIELTVRRHNQHIELRVRDDGMGMSADLLPGIFDLFRQGERTLDRAQGGLGIGLTLVRQLVELHGGQIEAQSPGPGQGSTFTLRLPMAATDALAAPEHAPASAARSGLRILVVDDDAMVAESMVVFLELDGHQVRSADSGHNALALLETFKPQVVLLDIGLPGQDGYEVARLIRAQPAGERVALVAVSGYGHDEAVQRSLQSGFARHLVKPVDPDALNALLAEIAQAG